MSTHLHRSLSVLASLLLAAAGVVAQEPGSKGSGTAVSGTLLREFDRVDAGEIESADGEGVEKGETKGRPLDPKAPRGGLERYARVVVGQEPYRVPPGGSGMLKVVLTLQGEHVIENGAHVEVRSIPEQGPITVDATASRTRPAEKGRLYERYRGTLVHENTMTIDVPFSVSPDAAHGKYPVMVTPEVDVHNALAGQFMGRFFTSGRGEVVVGKAVPNLAPRRTSGAARASADPAPAGSDDGRAGAAGAGDVEVGGDGRTGRADLADRASSGAGQEDPDPASIGGLPAAEQVGTLWVWVLPLGGLLVLVGLLALLRRR